jgi:hypothetical protein
LVLDELTVRKVTNYGFEIFEDNVKRLIDNISVDGDCVYISTPVDMNGSIEVVYAGQYNLGHGNLRDSDDEQAFYNYIDLDKKNHDGIYVYERDATETTLRPSYEPRDADGILYDKPYPLYNFSVAFYYKLEKGVDSFSVPNIATSLSNSNLKEDKLNVRYRNNCLIVDGLEDEDLGKVFLIIDMRGRVLYNQIVTKSFIGANESFPLVLERGIYCLKLSGVSDVTHKSLKVIL